MTERTTGRITGRKVASKLLAVFAAAALAGAALASDWRYYETKPFGFSMLVPTGTRLVEREWGGGWGGLSGRSENVMFYAQAKLGYKETDTDIETYALRTIGIPASAWIKIDQGANTRGWERFATFKANLGSKLYYGMYGVGKKGNYLLYLETTPSDYMAYKTDYDKWYESIRLD